MPSLSPSIPTDASLRRTGRRREHLPGFILPSSQARIKPVFTPDLPTLRILQLLSQFGAVPLQVAAKIAALVDRRPTCRTYWSSQSLERAGIIARVSRKELRLPPVPGLGLILVPGKAWASLPEELGLDPIPSLSVDSKRGAICEQIVFVGEILERVAGGDRFLSGTEWLTEAAARPAPWWGAQHAMSVKRAVADGTLALPTGDTPAGLIPHDSDERPILFAGGIWTKHTHLARLSKALESIGPINFVAWTRNSDAESLLRLRVLGSASKGRKKKTGQVYQHELTLLPRRSQRPEWAARWKRVMAVFASSDQELVRERLTALVGGGADAIEAAAS